MKAGFAKGNALLVGGAVTALAVAAGLYVSGVFAPAGRGLPDGTITAPQPVVQAPVETPIGETAQEPAEQPAEADRADAAEDTSAVPDAESAPTPAPSFDVVRVEPDGTTVIAGRAEPSATVAILLDRVELTQARADAEGRFVSFLTLPRSDKARVLTLAANGRAGAAEVILAPTPVARPEAAPAIAAAPEADAPAAADPTAEAPVVAALAPEDTPVAEEDSGAAQLSDEAPAPEAETPAPVADAAATDPAPTTPVAGATPTTPDADLTPPATAEADAPAASDTVAAVEDSPEPVTTPDASAPEETVSADSGSTAPITEPADTAPPEGVAEATAPEEPAAPTVLLSDAEGVRVLQAPAATAPQVMSSVALDAISYSDTGSVELAGRAPEGGFVRIYLDNAPITSSRIEAGGNWRTALPEIDEGVYTLRIDQVDDAGQVTSRIETPFKREARAQLAAADTGPDAPVRSITVQPGNTLWAIARDTYGEGVLYLRVFDANRSQIRDPDLIYPGQVFALPE